MNITCRHQDGPPTSRPSCSPNLPSARGRLLVTRSRRWSIGYRRSVRGLRKNRLSDGWAYLVQSCQEGAGHEGSKHDWEVVVGQDMCLAIFPSSTGLCLLFLCKSRRRRGELGFFFGAGHVPVLTMNSGGRGWENGSWSNPSGLINPHQSSPTAFGREGKCSAASCHRANNPGASSDYRPSIGQKGNN